MYAQKAKALLDAHKQGINPFADCTISMPAGVKLDADTKEGQGDPL